MNVGKRVMISDPWPSGCFARTIRDHFGTDFQRMKTMTLDGITSSTDTKGELMKSESNSRPLWHTYFRVPISIQNKNHPEPSFTDFGGPSNGESR
jgi:hypothetical protein